MEPTHRMSEFVVDTSFTDIPTEVINHSKKLITDTIGVALAGSDESSVTKVGNLQQGTGSSGSVIGSGEKKNMYQAALINGTMAHALDFDDYSYGRGHTSACILPATIAAGEDNGSSGEEILTAFVLGTESQLVLGNILNPELQNRGWHQTSILGHIGAAIATAVLLNLNGQQIRRTIGIAASLSSGVKGNFGTMTKPYHAGISARGGVEAAYLAKEGFTASEDIFEADFGGFFDLFKDGQDFDSSHVDTLGSDWEITDPAVAIKPYPSCAGTHAAIEAALLHRDSRAMDTEGIEQIYIRERPKWIAHTDNPAPETGLEGKFSVQYCVATALQNGSIWLDDFSDSSVKDRDVLDLAKKVTVEGDSNLENDCVMTISTNTAEYKYRIDAARGTAKSPLTQAEVESKFENCSEGKLTPDGKEEVLEIVRDLESQSDIGGLMQVLS